MQWKPGVSNYIPKSIFAFFAAIPIYIGIKRLLKWRNTSNEELLKEKLEEYVQFELTPQGIYADSKDPIPWEIVHKLQRFFHYDEYGNVIYASIRIYDQEGIVVGTMWDTIQQDLTFEEKLEIIAHYKKMWKGSGSEAIEPYYAYKPGFFNYIYNHKLAIAAGITAVSVVGIGLLFFPKRKCRSCDKSVVKIFQRKFCVNRDHSFCLTCFEDMKEKYITEWGKNYVIKSDEFGNLSLVPIHPDENQVYPDILQRFLNGDVYSFQIFQGEFKGSYLSLKYFKDQGVDVYELFSGLTCGDCSIGSSELEQEHDFSDENSGLEIIEYFSDNENDKTIEGID